MDLSDYEPEPDLSRATTLPRRWYVEPEFLRLESQRIFARTWQPVCRVDQVAAAGDFCAGEIAGEPVLVARGHDGVLRAFANVCRHRASVLAEGCGNKKSWRCPYHGWTYSTDGRLLGAPEFEGVAGFSVESVRLPQHRVESFGPFVFVNQWPDAPGLAEVLGRIPEEAARLGCRLDRLRFHARRDYVLDCNWKVYVDNYLEGYHLPVVHPGLFRELDYERYRVDTFRQYSSQFAPIRPAKAGAGAEARRYGSGDVLYYWIFPNVMLNIYPDNLSSNLVVPLGHDRTLTIFEWYFDEDAPPDESSAGRAIAFSDEIQREDIRICEIVQRGLQSPSYDRGRFSVKRENGVHHFQLLVSEHLRRG